MVVTALVANQLIHLFVAHLQSHIGIAGQPNQMTLYARLNKGDFILAVQV